MGNYKNKKQQNAMITTTAKKIVIAERDNIAAVL